MENTNTKFFKDDKVFYALPWLYMITCLLSEFAIVVTYIKYLNAIPLFDIITKVLTIALVFGIAISYKKHEKNVMKMLVGALLFSQVLVWIQTFCSYAFSSSYGLLYKTCVGLLALCFIEIFIGHIVLASSHKSNPQLIKANQAVAIGSIVLSFGANFFSFQQGYVMMPAISILEYFSLIAVIVSIESRVDEFKQIREQKAAEIVAEAEAAETTSNSEEN